ncbi:MAG: hypothetical protein ABJG14_18525 [Sulfitobacter sp.]|uniref:hypothetical protein n=2 Tax=Alphaproteobacteria TaxID=28211 RepID=UPI003267C484
MMNTTNTAEKLTEFDPVWADLDDLFEDRSEDAKPTEEIFDMMIERQGEEGHDLKAPCQEAQELIDQWELLDGAKYLQDWRAAVARRKPGISEVEEPEDGTAETSGPEPLNDAVVLGEGGDDLVEFLGQKATFLLGEMWGARDRRNTQDGDWNQVDLTWMQWLLGQPGDKNTPAWGFTRHPEGKDKAGASIVLGSSIGGARKAKAMDEMFAMGLDVDSGAKLEEVVEKIEELGLLCFVYSSYNHNKRGIELKRDEVLRKMQLKKDPTTSEVRQFLREHDKNRYEEDFIARCTIKDQKHQTTEGVKIVLDTPPLQKFRLIFPLSEAVKIIDLAETHQAALDLWEDKITGLARNVLEVHFDTSCTDPSRLFYTARHPKGNDSWYCAVVQGKPLAFDDIEPMKKSSYTSKREVNAFTMAGGEEDVDRPPMAVAPSGASLNEWHRTAKDRLMLADLMETLCPDRIRVAGGEAQGTVHTECPFEAEHTSEGGTATMAVNCIDSQNEYWTWFCHHDACQGRHKLQFVEEALRQGWFEEDVLFNMDHGFLLEAVDGVEDDPLEPQEAKKAREQEKSATFEEQAACFDKKTTDPEIEKLIEKAIKAKVDSTTKARIIDALVNATVLGRQPVKDMWKKEAGKARATDSKEEDRPDGIFITEPAPDQTQYACDSIKSANEKEPFLFKYMEDAAFIRDQRIRIATRAEKRHQVGRVASYLHVNRDGEARHIYPPYDVVDDVFASDLSEFLLPIRGAVDTPFFAADGTLVTENGYHFGSEVYLQSELELKRVSAEPTPEEVHEAKRLLIEEVLADFPLGALSRPEIEAQALNGDGVAAVTNLIALILLPFMREMVDGPTPGHMLTKPAAGTGASKLVDVISTIATGQVTPALAMPARMEEMSKTLTSVLSNGQNIVLFDNINHSVDSGELASAMTAPIYQARILGKSQTVEVAVRCAWVFTGNNVTLTSELARRLLFINLDAKVAHPEKRTGFRHGDILGWTEEHRAELVWACLTIIQNWVAKGMVKQRKVILASYENWSGVVGGVLRDAGMGGFLEGQKDEREKATDAAQDGIQQLMDIMSAYDDGTLFRPGGTAQFAGERTISIMDVLNGVERFGADADQGDPIQMNGWGYNSGDGTYNRAAPIRSAFEKLARKPYAAKGLSGEDYTLRFEVIDDRKNGSVVFRMTKEAA